MVPGHNEGIPNTLKLKLVKSINDHESKTLNLDISKSLKKLSWKPYLPINEAIQLTSQWFKQKEGGKLPSQIIKDQINYYEEKKLFQAQSIRDHIQ